jgi:hypothetical protein
MRARSPRILRSLVRCSRPDPQQARLIRPRNCVPRPSSPLSSLFLWSLPTGSDSHVHKLGPCRKGIARKPSGQRARTPANGREPHPIVRPQVPNHYGGETVVELRSQHGSFPFNSMWPRVVLAKLDAEAHCLPRRIMPLTDTR